MQQNQKYGYPRRLVTDKAPSIKSALKRLNKTGYKRYHTDLKYLNNMIESDHRFIKKRYKSYKTMNSARRNIKGLEVMHALYKHNKKTLNLLNSVFLPCQAIESLLDVA